MPRKSGSKSRASVMKKKVAGGVLVGGARKKRATSKSRKPVGGKIVGAASKKRVMSKSKSRGGSKSVAKKVVKHKAASKTVKKAGGASKSGRKLSAYNVFVKKFLADMKKSPDYDNYSPRERMSMAAAAYRKA